MAVRLLFTISDNEGHLLSMRYLVLSPFPASNGDHLDPLSQRRTSSNSSRILDPLPPHRYWISSPAGYPPRNAEAHICARLAQPPRVPADRSPCGHRP
jgi:hypothetical protein